jgi:hypothetical protein
MISRSRRGSSVFYYTENCPENCPEHYPENYHENYPENYPANYNYYSGEFA